MSEVPTITVSQMIVDELRGFGRNVFLVPNFPLHDEVEQIQFQEKHYKFSCVYVGNDLSNLSPHRNITYLPDIFRNHDLQLTVIGDREYVSNHPNITSLGFLSHEEMMNELTKHHVGLLPWLPHSYHKYCLPNKVAEYAHAGLLTLTTSSFTSVNQALKWCYITFDRPVDLTEILLSLKTVYWDKDRIIRFARENLIWERYEENILKAYSLVVR